MAIANNRYAKLVLRILVGAFGDTLAANCATITATNEMIIGYCQLTSFQELILAINAVKQFNEIIRREVPAALFWAVL
jgi:hypothetical protein